MKVFVALLALVAVAHGLTVAERRAKTTSGTAADRSALRKKLFVENEYDGNTIPDDVIVKFGLTLLNLEVDEERGTIETDIWIKYGWDDTRIQWDNKTNGINALRINNEDIWKPDIALYNSAQLQDLYTVCAPTNPIVYPSGSMIYVPPCHFSARCNFTLDESPFGEQTCILKFGSWVYDGYLMDLQFWKDEPKADLSYYNSATWEIISANAVRTDKFYPCCPEPYPDITYTLVFKQKKHNNCEKKE